MIYLIDFAEVDASSSTRDSYVVRDAMSLQVSGLFRNTDYFFTVVAQNNKNKLSISSERGEFTTLGAFAAQMDAPTVVKTQEGLLLSWNDLVTNVATGGLPIISFVVYTRRQDEVGFDSGLNIGNVISYQVQGLTPNFFYEFSISAVNSLGTGSRGKASGQIMPPIPPTMQAPTARVIDDGVTSVIEVSWVAPELATNVLNYRVFLRQIAPFTAMDNGTVVPATQRSMRFSYLPDGTRFEMKVAAQTSSGLTNISSGVFAETFSNTIPTSVKTTITITGTTTCLVNVTWTKPRLQASRFRVFSTINSITGADSFTSGSTNPFFVTPICTRGATYIYYVQAIFNEGSGGVISLDAPAVDVPVSPPTKMAGPMPVLNPQNPSTSIMLSWISPVIVNAVPRSIITSYILELGHPQASTSADTSKVIIIQAPSTTLTLTGLEKKTYYTFKIQARNSLGPSAQSELSSITTSETVPSPVFNLTVVPGSENTQGNALTLSWSILDWGESDKAGPPFPYPYCPETWPAQTPCGGRRYFLVTPFRVGDDYREATFVYGNQFQFTMTGLSGGVDYTFVVSAINTGGLEGGASKLKYRTVSVAPRAIRSLNVFVPANPDQGATYKIGLEWSIPIDAATTGGMALSGFTLRYANLTSCLDGCADASATCITQRANVPWITLAGVSVIDRYEWLGIKGDTYVFSIAAINGKGQGVFWPNCQHKDLNCQGIPNGQIPYTCHSAVYTLPSPLANFGRWAEGEPGVVPTGTQSFTIRWGQGNLQGVEYFNYGNRSLNGGRNIEMIEIQRSVRSNIRWPLNFYCPTLPVMGNGEQPVCLFQAGCTPGPCIAACPICVTSQSSENEFLTLKTTTDNLVGVTVDPTDTYVYRIRVSNVGVNDCASRPSSLGSSPACEWSAFSDLAEVKIADPKKFHNLKTRVKSPIAIEVLWWPPSDVLSGGATNDKWGDIVHIWYGQTVVSVSVAPFMNGNSSVGPARTTTFGKYVVSKLVPSTTYYFTVVSYYSSLKNEIESTRSTVTKAMTTAVGVPGQVQNTTVSVPESIIDIMAGGLLVEWIKLDAWCIQGLGVFLTDGSVDNCQQGEGIPLASYKIAWCPYDNAGATWSFILASSTLNKITVLGLEKEVKYRFRVSAINSAHEGMPSVEVTATPIATIPGSPPPPLSTGASVTSVRVAWEEPDDLGTKQVLETRFRLTIYPRRDGQSGNETITFTWEREYVVSNLRPNSLYLFSVAYQASPMLGFGFSSATAYVFTTPLAPGALQLSDGNNVTESTTVKIDWKWAGVIQGNVRMSHASFSFMTSSPRESLY